MEFHESEDISAQIEFFFDDIDNGSERRSEKDVSYIENKVRDIAAHLEEIDRAINAITEGWKTTRMGKVDLTLIRLAVYEMRYEEDIPTGVAINEAVELAKQYGTDGSPSFVNGILAKLV